ncbi:MAG: hypothetical protein KKD00_04330 [Gammaproteobacteria bacterium]|nr:hypothetical protein [Gammaproteobacteria bacterium]
MLPRKTVGFIAGTLVLSAVLSSLSVFIALTTARMDLQNDLAAQLPERLSEALRYSFADSEVFVHVDRQIRDDLADIRFDGLLPVLEACTTQLLRVSQQAPEFSDATPRSRLLVVNWSRGSEVDQAEFLLDCELDLPVLLGANIVMALLMMSCWWLLPAPMSASEKKLHDKLTGENIPAVYVRHILQKMQPADLAAAADDPWFFLAMQRYARADISLDKALSIVAAEPALYFHHSSHHVVIHGVSIALPKTPYFYCTWYAMQRQQNIRDGWILNPAADRPDHAHAAALITLMENFGGHQKAINDLKENGLRSKILDQNRNKIKDELVAALGEALAAGFLFETERDMRSSRYRYRLSCPPESIFMPRTNS